MWSGGRLIREAETLILDAINRLEPVDVVVLSDRYPPDVMGGAEISLHLALRELVGRHRFLVAAFTASPEFCGLTQVDGVTVIRLPISAPWPLNRWPVTVSTQLASVGLFHPIVARVSGFRAGLADEGVGAFGERLAALRLWMAGSSTGNLTEHLAQPIAWHLPLIRELILRCRPRLIHADNLYSILVAGEVARGGDLRLIGQVRDNRFLCARPDQDPRIAGVPCHDCALECMPMRNAAERRRVGLMSRTRDYRREKLRRLDRILVASDFLRRQVASVVPGKPLTRIRNSSENTATVAEWIADVSLHPGTPVAVVGTLKAEKGQMGLLQHLPAMVRQIPDLCLHLAGRGPQEDTMKTFVVSAGMSRHVIFHGQLARRELYRLLRACRMVVVPSLWPEPCGRVPVEAALVERPVAAFESGGLAEVIEDGVTGLLARTGDYEQLASCVVKLAQGYAMSAMLATNAYQIAVANNNPREISKEILGIWCEEILSNRQ